MARKKMSLEQRLNNDASTGRPWICTAVGTTGK
jgi:hypothetical protein